MSTLNQAKIFHGVDVDMAAPGLSPSHCSPLSVRDAVIDRLERMWSVCKA